MNYYGILNASRERLFEISSRTHVLLELLQGQENNKESREYICLLAEYNGLMEEFSLIRQLLERAK